MATVRTLTKGVAETRLFTMDWSAHLNGRGSITASVWTIPAGITYVSNATASGNTKTTLMLSGGTVGNTYVVTNTITTTGGETLEQPGGILITAS